MELSKLSMASAAALCVLGASAAGSSSTPVSATGFEQYYNAGMQAAQSISPRTGDNDLGNSDLTGACWFTAEASEDTQVTAYDGDKAVFTKWPGEFDGVGDYFLKVSNSSPLFRTFKTFTSSDGLLSGTWPTAWEDINWIDDGKLPVISEDNTHSNLFVDTLVQFTPSEEAPAFDDVDKLVVFMNADSNLCVYANQIDGWGTGVPKVFVTSTRLEVGVWYRLTVKAMSDMFETDFEGGTPMNPAFIVYINGTAVSSSDTSAIAELFFDEASGYFAEGTAELLTEGKLFPSMVAADPGTAALSAVGFKGEGAVDDFVVTYIEPEFGGENPPVSTIDFTLSWGDDVSAVYYAIDGGTPVPATSDSLISGIDADSAVTVTAEPAADSWLEIDEESIPAKVENGGKYTITTKAIDPESIGDSATAADFGIEGGAFEAAAPETLKKVVAWAETAGVKPSEVSGMAFEGGNASTALEQEYLLNTDADGLTSALESAVAALEITSISQDEFGNWVITYANSEPTYGNGEIQVKSFEDVGCTVESAAGNFFRAYLVLPAVAPAE